MEPRNIDAVLAAVREHWAPRTVAVVNDYDVRVVKVRGELEVRKRTRSPRSRRW